MKIVVIGLGSMGKRRIRLIKELYPEYEIIGVDGREDRRNEASELFGISCFESVEELARPDDSEKTGKIEPTCAFVCTSPLSHAAIISACLQKGWNVFTEINLVSDGYDENLALAKQKNLTLFLSSTFLYRDETRYIKSAVAASPNKKWNYIYHIGQYLPDWHPWESYKDFFIGDRRTNGCREVMAIEMPWLTAAFGEIEKVTSLSDKITDLQIDFEDNYMLTIQHENGNKGVLIVDVVSPVAVRKFEAYTEKSYISWDGTPDSIQEFGACRKTTDSEQIADAKTEEPAGMQESESKAEMDAGMQESESKDWTLHPVILSEKAQHQDGYRAFIIENAYKNEIREFFDVIQNGKKPIYGFEQDKKILELVDSVGA